MADLLLPPCPIPIKERLSVRAGLVRSPHTRG